MDLAPERHSTMPQTEAYEKVQPTAFESLQVEYEQDVLQTKLDAQVDSMMNDILGEYAEGQELNNTMIRDRDRAMFRSYPRYEKEGRLGCECLAEVLDYVRADRLLKDSSVYSLDEINQALDIKAEGLKKIPVKDEAYHLRQKDEKLMLSTIANIKVDQILEKRVQLQNKLKMIENLNNAYQLEHNGIYLKLKFSFCIHSQTINFQIFQQLGSSSKED